MGEGPLAGVRIVEITSIGPGPFGAMMLSDLGADVVRVDRPGAVGPRVWNLTERGRPAVEADLKSDEGRELVLKLCEGADALQEGFRPGVMERLGLGPEVVLERNPKLVYARMTGYGQDGPMANVAGHDINYISLGGALGAIGRPEERPTPPINLVGDFGGGGMMLALGIVAGVLEARTSGKGQVVDVSMVEGTGALMALMYAMHNTGLWKAQRGTNFIDTGAHFYETYETADGRYMAVGAIEPQFYAELLRILEIPAEEMPQMDQARWPEFKQRLAAIFKTRTRDEWVAAFESAEACTTGIYGIAEAPGHPHNVARDAYVEVDGVRQPAPTPRFSRTPGAISGPPPAQADDPAVHLARWGVA